MTVATTLFRFDEVYALTDDQLTRLMRIWLANRGIWDGLPGAGPPSLSPPPART